jgi:peptidoglycan-N-acetylglucosamine deacetylase
MLTFDDGPDPVWTPRLLDVLSESGARATFFPIASRAASHPRLVARMLEDGHAVGLHCLKHIRHSARSPAWLRRDTADALELMSSVGVRPSAWRTPWGDTAAWSHRVAQENGLRIVGWDIDTHDWRGHSAQQMVRRTMNALTDGAVVLAHDGIGPGALRDDAAQTVEYARLILAQADAARLELVAAS